MLNLNAVKIKPTNNNKVKKTFESRFLEIVLLCLDHRARIIYGKSSYSCIVQLQPVSLFLHADQQIKMYHSVLTWFQNKLVNSKKSFSVNSKFHNFSRLWTLIVVNCSLNCVLWVSQNNQKLVLTQKDQNIISKTVKLKLEPNFDQFLHQIKVKSEILKNSYFFKLNTLELKFFSLPYKVK